MLPSLTNQTEKLCQDMEAKMEREKFVFIAKFVDSHTTWKWPRLTKNNIVVAVSAATRKK